VRLGATGVDDVLSGENNFVATFRAEGESADARRRPRQRLRNRAHEHQAVDRRLADSRRRSTPLELIFKRRPIDADSVTEVVVRCATSEAALVDNREIARQSACSTWSR